MVGRGWTGGIDTIKNIMHGLFGDVREPWRTSDEDVPVTEVHDVVSPEPQGSSALVTAKLTRPKRFPNGTISDCYDPKDWRVDADEAATRGHRRIRRASSPRLAA
jgi:hypothetical protein